MPLEIYKYRKNSGRVVGYEVIPEGEHRTLENYKKKGDNEIIVLYCRKDNKLSVAYTIHPVVIIDGNPSLALYQKTEVENRALVIKPGQEEVIDVSEPIGKQRRALMRYRLSHR